MKRMLINATHNEELRVALVDGQKLYDLDIESRAREQKKSNIYKAKITRVEPSLEAAFVDYGGNRHGFLPLKEIAREYFNVSPSKIKGRINIAEVVKEGQEIIVQVEKEERGNKGAALTTFCSLAGRYLVLMPNNPRAGGISRRIEGEDREELRDTLSQLEIPKNMGVIMRTACVGRSVEELQWDLDYLVRVFEAISEASEIHPAPFLIYQEDDIIIRAIRDYLREDIGEIQIDTQDSFDQANLFIEQVMPQFKNRLKLYESDVPLFNRFQIEGQIESAFNREVRLPSGGALVIDPTEALVSIDINSARATRGSDIEETALNTNLEAAEEVGRQLRLRDIGGLVVIDFIDMSSQKNQRAVENKMREALQLDRARVQVGKISRFGLLEMSRQRLRPSLGETSGIVCPRCGGLGTIRDVESSALAVIRMVEEESLKDTSAEIRAFLPISVSSFLLNEKRNVLSEIEARNEVRVVVVPDPNMETPHYRVERIRSQDQEQEETEASYEITNTEVEEDVISAPGKSAPQEVAAVKTVAPPARPTETSEPTARQSKPKQQKRTEEAKKAETKDAQPKEKGLLSRLFSTLFSTEPEQEPEEEAPKKQSNRNRNRRRNNNRKRDNTKRDQNNRDNNRENNRDSAGQKEENTEGRRRRRRNNDRDDQNENRGNESRKDRGRGRDDNQQKGKGTQEQKEQKEAGRSESEGGRRRSRRRTEEGDAPARGGDKRNRGNRERGNQKRRVSETEVTAEETTVATEAVTTETPEATAATTTPEAVTTASATGETQSTDVATQPEAAVPSEAEAPETVTSETPVVEPTPAAEQSAPAEVAPVAAHASTLGRLANDPREQPGQPVVQPVLQPGVALTAAPVPATGHRAVPQDHPSLVGRVANDPRDGSTQTEVQEVPETAAQASESDEESPSEDVRAG